MEIKVVNNTRDVSVIVGEPVGNTVTITIDEKAKKPLGEVRKGEVIELGGRKFIVLDHGNGTTAVITKDFAKNMVFGDDGDYRKSDVRKYCNGEFYNELAKAVGKENIIPHTINLMADDGTGVGKVCKDNVSILTTEKYRRYRRFLPKYGDWWWTATRVSAQESNYARNVCFVGSFGILGWSVCCYSIGVCPFCILNSSILVS